MNKEERKARIEILKKLLDDDRDLLEASAVLAAMLELYTLVHEDLIYGRNDRHGSMCTDIGDLALERANRLLWTASAADLKMDEDIKTFEGFIKQLKKEQES
jgi:hypothetical protein